MSETDKPQSYPDRLEWKHIYHLLVDLSANDVFKSLITEKIINTEESKLIVKNFVVSEHIPIRNKGFEGIEDHLEELLELLSGCDWCNEDVCLDAKLKLILLTEEGLDTAKRFLSDYRLDII